MIYWPEPIYKRLPVIYGFLGGCTMAYFDNKYGDIGGAALIMAGVLALYARSKFRSN